MPSCYAHYRFGHRMLKKLPPEARAVVRRNRTMYDLGVHGPDFLFYNNPIFPDRLYRLGQEAHALTGRTFFLRAVRQLRLDPGEGAQAYLWGVLTHFVLDSVCHPWVNSVTGAGTPGHLELESEFDRSLLERDGRERPHCHRITGHILLKNPEAAERIARFYPGVSPGQMAACIRNFRFLVDFCTAPEGLRRNLIGSGVFGGAANEMMMMDRPNPRCTHLIPQLNALYDRAEAEFPAMAARFRDHMTHDAPLGDGFDRVFG